MSLQSDRKMWSSQIYTKSVHFTNTTQFTTIEMRTINVISLLYFMTSFTSTSSQGKSHLFVTRNFEEQI